MINFWSIVRKIFNLDKKVEKDKPIFARKDVIILLICSSYLLLERIHVNPSYFTVQHSAVYEVDHTSLFDFVNHAATVERWFQWVSHYKSIDHRPPGVGKRYKAYFFIPYLGYEKIEFQVANYSAASHIVLVSSHVFKPIVEASVVPLDSSHTLFSVSVTFNENSLLYQLTIGFYLRYLAGKHIEDALILLNSIMKQ